MSYVAGTDRAWFATFIAIHARKCVTSRSLRYARRAESVGARSGSSLISRDFLFSKNDLNRRDAEAQRRKPERMTAEFVMAEFFLPILLRASASPRFKILDWFRRSCAEGIPQRPACSEIMRALSTAFRATARRRRLHRRRACRGNVRSLFDCEEWLGTQAIAPGSAARSWCRRCRHRWRCTG